MNIELFVKVLSDILSDKYGVGIKIRAERKTDVEGECKYD